ncbi:aspartyl protease family protein [Rhodomicrobium sp.]|uniref:aspartyl protease family protein n=1 Tax=Rhodomicrobium sp. TaxID=2720632 RepID=UPI0039E33933
MRWLLLLVVLGLSQAAHAKPADCIVEKKATLKLGWGGGMRTVEAEIDGQKVTLGLDTGASTIITPDAASRLHLMRDWDRRTRAYGTTAILTANHVLIKDLEFGGAHHRWKSVPVLAIANRSPSNPVSGLLGRDILSDYDVEFDFLKETLTLYSVRGCTTVIPQWPAGYTATPMTVTWRRNVLLPVDVDGKRFQAIFDTGATESALSREAAARLGVTSKVLKLEETQPFVGVGAVRAALPTSQFGKLAGAGIAIFNRRLAVLKIGFLEGEMLFGRDFMASNRFWISYATRTIFTLKQSPLILTSKISRGYSPAALAAGGRPDLQTVDPCDPAIADKFPAFCSARRTASVPPSKTSDVSTQPPQDTPPPKPEFISPCALSYGDKFPAFCTPNNNPLRTASPNRLPPAIAARLSALDRASTPRPAKPARPAKFRDPCFKTYFDQPPFCREKQQASEPPTDDQGWLGVRHGRFAAETQKTLGFPSVEVVAVIFVIPGSPADKAEIKAGDAIVAVDGVWLSFGETLQSALRTHKAGEDVDLTVFRGGEMLTFKATLGSAGAAAKVRRYIDENELEYRDFTRVFSREAYPLEWALARQRVGIEYMHRRDGTTAENVEKAIAAFEDALAVPEFREKKAAFAAAEEGLAQMILLRSGSNGTRIEEAVNALETALPLRERNSAAWAADELFLASAYERRGEGDPLDNKERAITAYDAAASALRGDEERRTACGVALAAGARLTLGRLKGDSAENAEAAILMVKEALPILADSGAHVDWAMAERKLGEAYTVRGTGDVSENLSRAREAYDAALTVLTKEAFPKEFAEIDYAKAQIADSNR